MELNPTTFYIISGVLVGTLVILVYIIRNLLVKVEKYEDTVTSLQNTLTDVQNTILNSQKHLNTLDERGVFKSDDEVGYFFEQLKEVQNQLDRFNNAQKEKQS
jgi:LPS O-antigen subunit length determinant protein (WzzB/FepE family)